MTGCLAGGVLSTRDDRAGFMNSPVKERMGRELLEEVKAEVSDQREHCDQKKARPEQEIRR